MIGPRRWTGSGHLITAFDKTALDLIQNAFETYFSREKIRAATYFCVDLEGLGSIFTKVISLALPPV